MAPDKKLRVIIGGASGETGTSIMNALLAFPDQFEPIALARPESVNKESYQDLVRRGVSVKLANFQDIEGLVPLLTGADVVISCLTLLQKEAEEAFIDAAYRAGVGRYVPSFFGPCAPPRGVMWMRDMKEELLDRYSAISFPETLVGADGNVKFAGTDVADIGKYVARIIADPCTLNKQVFAYSEVITQNHIWNTMEALTGETIPRKYLLKEEAEDTLARAKETLAKDPTNIGAITKQGQISYAYSWAIRGDNTPEHAKYLGYLIAKDLYPDVKAKPINDFIREIVDARVATYYLGRPDHPLNKAKALLNN